MSKSTLPKKSTNFKSRSQPVTASDLRRRGIHDEHESPDERLSDENTASESDSPQKKQGMYPDIPDSKELDQIVEQLKQNTKSKSKQSKATWQINFGAFSKYVWGILIAFIILAGSFFYFPREKPSQKMSLEEVISSMQSHFKNQNHLTFRILKKGLAKVVNDTNPSSPAIFTLVPNKNAKTTATEFSLYLAESLVSNKYVLINDSMYRYDKAEDVKLRIDEEIQSNINKSKPSVIIVDNLQKIPHEAALIFHSYCDHSLAPFKQAVFLFIVPSLDTVLSEDASSRTIDDKAMKQLRSIWYRASDDIIDSLITRITVNVINIR